MSKHGVTQIHDPCTLYSPFSPSCAHTVSCTSIQKWWRPVFEMGDVSALKLSMKVREMLEEPRPTLHKWQERNHTLPPSALTHTHTSGHEHKHVCSHPARLINDVWVWVEVSCCFLLSTFRSALIPMSNGQRRAPLLSVGVYAALPDGERGDLLISKPFSDFAASV